MIQNFFADQNSVETIDGITPAFPYAMHKRDLTNFVVPWHWHEELEFNYAFRSTITIETLHHTYIAHQGDAYFINTNVMERKFKAPGQQTVIEHAHLFHPQILSGHFRSIFETKYLAPILNQRELEVLIIREGTPLGKDFLRILRQLTELAQGPDREMEIRNKLSEGWLILMKIVKNQQKNLMDQPVESEVRIRSILNYLHTNFTERITLESIANQVGLSSKECSRIFQRYFQESPIDYLIQYRIDQSKQMLLETNDSITDIALNTGFSNSSYFAKMFKEHTQQTPRKFRITNMHK